jgi:hypothetical protein
VIGAASQVGEQLGDRTRGAGGLPDRFPGGGDQVAPDAPFADDLGVFVEAADVGQVEVESGEVGDASDGSEVSGLVEVGLESEEVGRGSGVGDVEEGLVEDAVPFEVPVAGLQSRADLGEVQGLEEEAAEDGALGLFAVGRGLGVSGLSRTSAGRMAAMSSVGRRMPESQRERMEAGPLGVPSSSGRSWLVTTVARPRSSRVRVRRRRSRYQSAAEALSGSSRTRRGVTMSGMRTSSVWVKSCWMRQARSVPAIQRPDWPVRRCSARRTVARPVFPVPVGPQRATQRGFPVQRWRELGQGCWKWFSQPARVRLR